MRGIFTLESTEHCTHSFCSVLLKEKNVNGMAVWRVPLYTNCFSITPQCQTNKPETSHNEGRPEGWLIAAAMVQNFEKKPGEKRSCREPQTLERKLKLANAR
jgi:hypothetical protein